VIAACGDLETATILDLLERSFGGWRRAVAPLPTSPAPQHPTRKNQVRLAMAREQTQIYLGHPGIRRSDPDYYRLLVMDHVLGTGPGFTDRISRKLRDEQGLCYSVSATICGSAGLEPGYFVAYIGTSPQHEPQAIDGFLEEIRRLRTQPPRADEVELVQQYLTGSFALSLERNASLAAFLIGCERHQLGLDYLVRYPDLVRAVTAAQVQEVAARHLDPERFHLVVVGPRK
jgi:zinc protease